MLCLLIAMLLELLVNLVLTRSAGFMKIVGWLILGLNILVVLVFLTLAFLRLSNYQQKYCLDGVGTECQFGEVLTYTTLGYSLVALAGCFVVVQVLSYRRIRQAPELSSLVAVLISKNRHVGVELTVAVARLAITAFFGSALLMAASDSTIVQTATSSIDSGIFNIVVYNSVRYWKIGASLLCYILAVRMLEKVRYFTIAVATAATDLTVTRLLFSGHNY